MRRKLPPLPLSLNGELVEPDWKMFTSDGAMILVANDVWNSVVAEMKLAGTLAITNGSQIKRYVQAVLQYDIAVMHVFKEGAIIDGKRNPWYQIMKDAESTASLTEDKLGLNPRRRGQVAVAKIATRKSKADQLLMTGV